MRKVAAIDWKLEAIAPILAGKPFRVNETEIHPDAWHVTSRMRLLVSLFHKYGIDKTLASLHTSS